MIIRFIVLLAFIAMPCLAVGADNLAPSHDQIKKWWNPGNREQPNEQLTIRDIHPIRLKSGERAYVASVSYPTRGRYRGSGILLVRPNLQEARETYFDAAVTVDEIIYLDGDRIDAVVMTGLMTAQGQTSGSRSVFHFDGWKPIILHKQGFERDGNCGIKETGRPCHFKEMRWTFTDLDGDGSRDLVELIHYGIGDEPDQMTETTKANVYLFKDKKFVLVQPGLTQSNSAGPQSNDKE